MHTFLCSARPFCCLCSAAADADADADVLQVTHDRYFLESTCTEVLELDGAAVHRYEGSYQAFLRQRKARLAADDANLEVRRC